MLKSLQINNFRALEDFTVSKLGRINLIVGRNNSGKSSILEALRIYAANADALLLDELAIEHDEYGLLKTDNEHTNQPNLPFQDFFSHRIFPKKDNLNITIGEINSEKQLIIEHGYVNKIIQETNGNNYTVNRIASFERVLKSQLNTSQYTELFDALFIRKGIYNNLILLDSTTYINKNKRFPLYEENIILRCSVIPTRFVLMDELADEWDKIALTDNQEIVKNALRIIEPDFQDIVFVSNHNKNSKRIAKIRLKNQNQPVPLNSMGEGMLHVFQLILKCCSAKDGFLLIDEFENGLHYSIQEKIWALVFDLAENFNIQVFATTHSWDCIKSFANISNKKTTIESILFRLGRSIRTSDKGKIISTVFDKEQLINITQSDIEVR